MADKDLRNLTEIDEISENDLVMVWDSSATSGNTKKSFISKLFSLFLGIKRTSFTDTINAIEFQNGLKIQWGIYDTGSNSRNITATINFPFEFKDINYAFNFSTYRTDNPSNYLGYVGTRAKGVSSISCGWYGNSTSDTTRYFQWFAIGF